MVTGNPSTFVSVLVLGIHLLLCCNPDEATIIESDIQSRTGRQYGMMPAIDPHLLAAALHDFFMNHQQPQQQTPSNTFSGWVSSPSSNIPIINSDSSQSTFDADDETLLTSRQQQQFPCGRGPAALPQRQIVGIVGGTEAKKNSWPFIVAIRRNNGGVSCGGSLISPDKILTAAHCVEKLTTADIDRLTVSLGMHTVGDEELGTTNDAQMTRRVSRVIMHNGYNTLKTINDIAILILESPVVYSDAISPVCLAPASPNPNQYLESSAAIIGWGRLTGGGESPDVLQQATIKFVDSDFCTTLFPATSNQLCVMDAEKGLCNGDSGGPIIVRSATGAWIQVGIVSYGFKSCTAASVLTRVSAYRSWIDRNSIQ